MAQRSVRTIIKPQRQQIGPLTMHQPLPANGLTQIDPFLLLHHHGPQTFGAHNAGLPFGPHPHRGFETVTFIYEGDVRHRDSNGFSSTIQKGGIQWMTTGRGLVHSESSSESFRQKGGLVELIQLWTNLSGRLKGVEPNYTGLQKDQIPDVVQDNGKVTVALVSGDWNGTAGPIKPVYDVDLATVTLSAGGTFTYQIDPARNVLFYVLNGSLTVNGQSVDGRALVVFNNDGDELVVEATTDARILLGSAPPINEPVVSYGPFVMNTQAEIRDAIADYQSGRMGYLEEE